MTRHHPATTPLLAGLLILLLAAALSALFDEPERMRSWGSASVLATEPATQSWAHYVEAGAEPARCPWPSCPLPSPTSGCATAAIFDDWRERRWA